jgi:hypothetical protein
VIKKDGYHSFCAHTEQGLSHQCRATGFELPGFSTLDAKTGILEDNDHNMMETAWNMI